MEINNYLIIQLTYLGLNKEFLLTSTAYKGIYLGGANVLEYNY